MYVPCAFGFEKRPSRRTKIEISRSIHNNYNTHLNRILYTLLRLFYEVFLKLYDDIVRCYELGNACK